MKKLFLVVLLLSVTAFVGCGGSSSSGGNTPPPVTLQSIQVAPATPSINAGATQQFTATGTYSDGSTKNLTSSANWLSSSGTVATINISGLAAGVAVGTTTISAASGGITGTTILTVTNPLRSITVSPATASVAYNAQQQFTATGNYTFGSPQDITSSVTWSASTGATITAGGLATASTPNATVTIMATLGSVSGTAIMTVTNPLVSIGITPLAPSIAASFTQQFTATGTYADNSTQVLTSSVTWASSNTAFATISNTLGTQGLATGVAAGTVQITATSGTIVGTTTLTVTSSTLLSIAVTPVAPAIIYQTQQQFTATGTFSDSSTQNITNTVTWTSSDTAHISITPTGLATGVATISTGVTIKASQNGVNGSTSATVVPAPVTSIAITPNNTNLAVGTSRHYAATATLQNGSTLNVTSQATWTSSNPSAATIVSYGLVKGTATGGTTVITATYNGVSSNFTLSVNNVTVNSITVTPIAATMPVGVTQRFSATAVFSDTTTQDITMDVVWASSMPSFATISNTLGTQGVATSVAIGTTSITAAFGGVTSPAAALTVDNSTLSSIAVSPGSTVLPVGKTVNYNAYGTYSDGLTFVISNLATWTSSAPTLVSINTTGTANTLLPGPPVTITASYQGKTANATVIVTQFPLVSIAVTPTTAQVPVAVSTPFTAVGTFSDQSTQNLTSYATWAANPSSVATVNQSGMATGSTPGLATITAVFGGVVSNNAAVTVSNATLSNPNLVVSPSSPNVAVGSQVPFRAVGTFSDGSVIDLTSQVTWTSSNPAVATFGNAGVCNTAAVGTSVITATFDGATGTANLTVH